MLKETARVVSTSPGKAKVAIVRSEACGSCPAKSMCSAASGNMNILEVNNPVEAKRGEKVIIELRPTALVKATAMLYLFPAVAIVAGATAGWLRSGSDTGAMVGALAGFAASSLFLYLHGRKQKSESGPKISKILAPSGIGNIGHHHKSHSFSS